MRAYGRRGVLVLAVAVLTAAGCTDARPQTTGSSPVAASTTAGPAKPAVTPAEARKIFTDYVATDSLTRQMGLQNYEQDLVAGGRASLAMAEYGAAGGRPKPHRWGAPTMWVPRLAADDKAAWFSLLAERDGKPAIATFVREGANWALTSVAVLVPGQAVPRVELDADGFATALSSTDKSVGISPTFMAPLHAAVAETGLEGITAGLIAPGPYTTEVADQIDADRKRWRGLGYDYDSIFSAGELRTFALRTEDGGALVQYSLNRSSSVTNRTDDRGSGIPVPPELGWLVPARWAQLSLKTSEIHQYATAVPPMSETKPAVVVAHDGGVYDAKATN